MPGITFQMSTKQTQSKPLTATFTEQSFNYWGGGTAVALECCEFSFLIQQQ